MPNFKTELDSAIKARNYAISKSLLPDEALAFINSMLDGAIRIYETNIDKAKYKVTCAHSLVKYFIKPEISLWDENSKLKEYLQTIKLP